MLTFHIFIAWLNQQKIFVEKVENKFLDEIAHQYNVNEIAKLKKIRSCFSK